MVIKLFGEKKDSISNFYPLIIFINYHKLTENSLKMPFEPSQS